MSTDSVRALIAGALGLVMFVFAARLREQPRRRVAFLCAGGALACLGLYNALFSSPDQTWRNIVLGAALLLLGVALVAYVLSYTSGEVRAARDRYFDTLREKVKQRQEQHNKR